MRYILTISCLLTSLWALAQPVALPLTSNPVLQEYVKTHPKEATSQLKSAPAALTLPFMDDFSYAGPYPTDALWMDNDVFVNNTLGMNPPSVGVATLDGLDADGLPYADSEGWSDTLTSRVFDLSTSTVSDNIILSFFVQPQGFGDAPESIDRLILEFKDIMGVWQIVESIPGSAVEEFQYSAHVLGSLYLGPEFQFRFRNFSARTGFVDLWHIDYVKMDEGRIEGSQVFEDVCFTQAPKSYLREFTAMPWRHYWDDRLGEVNFNLITSLQNHDENAANISNINCIEEEAVESIAIFTKTINNVNVPALESSEFDLSPQNTSELLINNLSGNLNQAKIITQYYITAPGQEVITNQENYNLTNDTVTTETIFSNYFSYDDGTAEYNVGLDGEGSQAAVRFRPNVDDDLQAIQIYIPYAADDVSLGQSFILKVWENNPTFNEPASEPIFSQLFTPQYGDGIGGFYTYEVDPPIPLTGAQDYFIGWEQNSIADYGIPIGMDKNNTEASDNNYYNLGLGWQPFPDNLEGALMIRAVVNGDPFFVNNEPTLNASEIAEIFPNPTDDNLFINLKTNNYENYQIGIFNSAGQLMYMNQLQPSIPVNTLANGMYFIQIKEMNTNAVYYEKFVKK